MVNETIEADEPLSTGIAPKDLAPLVESKESPPFFVAVGSTVVAGPEFVAKVVSAAGDGTGTRRHDTRSVLREIALGSKTFGDLDTLGQDLIAEEVIEQEGPGAIVRAAAYVQRFIEIKTNIEAKRRNIPFPQLWMRIFVLNGEPYVVASLERKRVDFLGMLFRSRGANKSNESHLPPYGGGVLEGLHPVGGRYLQEDSKHVQLGPLSYRLAALVETARQQALGDFRLDPSQIEVVLNPQEGYPEGRLCAVIHKKPRRVTLAE